MSARRSSRALLALVGAGAIFTTAESARAQEAMYTQAATMPAPGTIILREQFHWYRYGSHPVSGVERTDKLEAMTTIAYGLDRGLALFVDVPITHVREKSPTEDNTHTGIDDVDVMLKWRFYQKDSGGIDTIRAALLAGVEFSFEDTFAAHPMLGAVITVVRGRHGFNQDLIYHLNTDGSPENNLGGDGPYDALAFNTAYLYRFYPDRYTSDSVGAWYVTAEINGLYETNGDVELRWAPGLMYEGRIFAFELMAQFPLWNDLDNRPELDFALGIGFRFIF